MLNDQHKFCHEYLCYIKTIFATPILLLLRQLYVSYPKTNFATARLFLLHQDIFFYIKNSFTMPRQFLFFSSHCRAECEIFFLLLGKIQIYRTRSSSRVAALILGPVGNTEPSASLPISNIPILIYS